MDCSRRCRTRRRRGLSYIFFKNRRIRSMKHGGEASISRTRSSMRSRIPSSALRPVRRCTGARDHPVFSPPPSESRFRRRDCSYLALLRIIVSPLYLGGCFAGSVNQSGVPLKSNPKSPLPSGSPARIFAGPESIPIPVVGFPGTGP